MYTLQCKGFFFMSYISVFRHQIKQVIDYKDLK